MSWWRSRKFWKISVPLVLLAIIALVVWRGPHGTHPQRIVVILPSPSNPFWIEVRRGVDHAATILG
jgi:ABC-type sugar transport system substrate-binding protein